MRIVAVLALVAAIVGVTQGEDELRRSPADPPLIAMLSETHPPRLFHGTCFSTLDGMPIVFPDMAGLHMPIFSPGGTFTMPVVVPHWSYRVPNLRCRPTVRNSVLLRTSAELPELSE